MKYLAITAKVQNANNYVGWFADGFAGFATAKTREGVEAKLPLLLASYFADNDAPQPRARSLGDVDPELLEGTENVQTLEVEPAPINPVSLEIERALDSAGINQAELARRLGVSRASVSNLLDPFYFGHSMASLQRVADALGMRLDPPRFKRTA
jgi:antitoxin HicB